MFATLGNIEFNLHTSPTADSDTLEIPWVEHELINQPQQLQPAGRNLVEKELEMFFHASFCKVEERVKELKDAAENYDVMALLMGNGKLIGDFVITNIVTKTDQADELGNRIAVTLSVTLKEYVSDKLQNEQKKADKKAFATGNKKAVTNKKSTQKPGGCKQHVSEYASFLRSYQGKEKSEFTKYKNLTDAPSKQNVAWNIRSYASVVKNRSASMQQLHNDCLVNAGGMDFQVSQLVGASADMITAFTGTDIVTQTRAHSTWNSWIDIILNKATQSNSETSVRKP